MTHQGGHWFGVPSRSVLYSGENMRLEVGLQHPAYLYILTQTNEGDIELLYPADESENSLLPAASVVQLPSPDSAFGDVFVLDEIPGQETLYVVASNRRLPRSVQRLVRLLDSESQVLVPVSGDPELNRYPAPPPPSRPLPRAQRPPGPTGPTVRNGGRLSSSRRRARNRLATRGLQAVRSETRDGTIDAAPDSEGIAVVLVEIDHR